MGALSLSLALMRRAQRLMETVDAYSSQFSENVHAGESREKEREGNYKQIVRGAR